MKEINVNIAWLRLLASFGVICLHTFGGQASLVDNIYSYMIWYMFTFSIPIFFSTSGYFSLNKEIDWKNIYKKIKNILIFLLAWGILYVVFQVLKDIILGNKIKFSFLLIEPIKLMLLSFLQMGFFSRFWFFGAFAIILILSPFLSKVFQKTKFAIVVTVIFTIISLISNIVNYIYIYIFHQYIRMKKILGLDKHLKYGYL